MNGNDTNRPALPHHDRDAVDWFRRAMDGHTPPARLAPGVNALKADIRTVLLAMLEAPTIRDTILLRGVTESQPEPRMLASQAQHQCPTCGQNAVLDVSNERCPVCSKRMALRRNRTQGTYFLGCTGYPECRGTRDLRKIMLERAETRQHNDAIASGDHRQINL